MTNDRNTYTYSSTPSPIPCEMVQSGVLPDLSYTAGSADVYNQSLNELPTPLFEPEHIYEPFYNPFSIAPTPHHNSSPTPTFSSRSPSIDWSETAEYVSFTDRSVYGCSGFSDSSSEHAVFMDDDTRVLQPFYQENSYSLQKHGDTGNMSDESDSTDSVPFTPQNDTDRVLSSTCSNLSLRSPISTISDSLSQFAERSESPLIDPNSPMMEAMEQATKDAVPVDYINSNLVQNVVKEKKEKVSTPPVAPPSVPSKEVTVDPGDDKHMLPPGLINNGNICFMNSIIQALNAIPLIRDTLLRCIFNIDSYDFESTIEPHMTGYFLIDMLQLMSEKPSNLSKRKRSIDTKHLQLEISQNISGISFRKGEQQDAHEFFLFALNELQGALNRACREHLMRYEANVPMDAVMKMCKSKFTTPSGSEHIPVAVLEEAFRGVSCITTQCQTCGSKSRREEFWSDVSLPVKLPDGKYCTSLSESLRACFSNHLFEGDNQYQCDPCGGKRDAIMCTKIEKIPPVLVMHMILFQQDMYGRTSKIQHSVSFPDRLNIQDYVVSSNSQSMMYELTAIVAHWGSSRFGGHYVAAVKTPKCNSWILCSDETVKYISEEEMMARLSVTGKDAWSPYLLFYTPSK